MAIWWLAFEFTKVLPLPEHGRAGPIGCLPRCAKPHAPEDELTTVLWPFISIITPSLNRHRCQTNRNNAFAFRDKSSKILQFCLSAKQPQHLTHSPNKPIHQSFQRVRSERTEIFVVHKIATDVIFVFKDGHAMERGKHTELLQQAGLYADLVRWRYSGLNDRSKWFSHVKKVALWTHIHDCQF